MQASISMSDVKQTNQLNLWHDKHITYGQERSHFDDFFLVKKFSLFDGVQREKRGQFICHVTYIVQTRRKFDVYIHQVRE